MKSVDDLLSSLRAHGTIDSHGEFTLSLSEARRKLTHFHTSDNSRYLLLVISAGLAAGAQGVHLQRQRETLEVNLPGAYLPEADLLACLTEPLKAGAAPGASDLVMGLQAAFALGVNRIEVQVRSPNRPSYIWHLEPETERSSPLSTGQASGVVVILSYGLTWRDRLKGLLGSLRGYAAMPPEIRQVDRFCDHSPQPISYQGDSITRPLVLPRAPVQVQVGLLPHGVLGFQPDRTIGGVRWQGALALLPGSVQLVVHGVSYCRVDSTGLTGVVYCDALKRDASRERIVQDSTYLTLLDDLEGVRHQLYETLAYKLETLDEAQLQDTIGELVLYFLRARLSPRAQKAVWGWLQQALTKQHGADSKAEFRPSPVGLVQLFRTAVPDPIPSLVLLSGLLEESIEGLQESRRAGFSSRLRALLRMIEAYDSSRKLIIAYYLLGLGALHSLAGREAQAEKAWFRSLEVVWSGDDERAHQLIYAHMGFTPTHIVDQVRTALTMHLWDVREELQRARQAAQAADREVETFETSSPS